MRFFLAGKCSEVGPVGMSKGRVWHLGAPPDEREFVGGERLPRQQRALVRVTDKDVLGSMAQDAQFSLNWEQSVIFKGCLNHQALVPLSQFDSDPKKWSKQTLTIALACQATAKQEAVQTVVSTCWTQGLARLLRGHPQLRCVVARGRPAGKPHGGTHGLP